MRILVTGAAGFVGQSIIRVLAQHGHSLTALIHERALPGDLQGLCTNVVQWNICEKNLPDELLHKVDAVCHAAAYIPNQYNDLGQAEKCYQTNALATLNLASQASDNKVGRFIFISTGNMYGFSETAVTERDPIFPSAFATPYFVSKLAGEIYASHVCSCSGMTGVILRIGTPYGPGEPQNKAIPALLKQALLGKQLTIYHGGKPRYNFVYVEDIAACVEKALRGGETGIYNIASGESTSLKELTDTVISIFEEQHLEINILPETQNTPAGFAPLSIAKAAGTWDYRPVTLKNGLGKYLDALRAEAHQP